MTWNCTVCTFSNSNDRATRCEMCDSKRDASCASSTLSAGTTAKESPSKKSLRQQSLFGWTGGSPVVASKKAESNVNLKVSKKRKSQDASLITPALTTAPVSKSRHGGSPWQPTSTATINLADNFETLWKRSKVLRREIFNITKLRNQQPKAVQCALKGKHQIVVMATGGGKSLCYQLPATVIGGTTIVISPLIALMQDQVHSLHQKGVPAAHISSANTKKHNDQVLERLLGRPMEKKSNAKQQEIDYARPITLLYCTPELVQTAHFQKVLQEMYDNRRLALIAVDEAHCLSTWGHDFRKAYRRLNILRTRFPDIPCIACTATATPKVIQDIRETLDLQDAPCHLGSFDRDNIFYKVRFKESLNAVDPQGAMKNLVQFIQKKHAECQKVNSPCSGIVYVHKRQDTTLLASRINQTIRGVRAAPYSAALKDAERTQVQQQWTTGEVDVVIATVAFGMGIDLAHVRYVVHWSISKTVEAFYQESGRGGRDGLPSVSLVYFSREEANKFAYLLRQQKEQRKEKNNKQDIEKLGKDMQALEKMVDYCVTPACRRKYLLQHFGQDVSSTTCPKACDFCSNPQAVRKAIQASSAMKAVMTQQRQRKKSKVWDGQWKKPHGDDADGYASDNSLDKRKARSDLAITSYDANKTISSFSRAKSGMASSILAKYEVLECREKDTSSSTTAGGGFVRFRGKVNQDANNGTRQSSSGVKIPEHIAAKLAASFKANTTSSSEKPKEIKETSADHASKANRLRDELAKIKAQQESARLKILGKTATTTATTTTTSVASAPPPPPPTLTFRRKRKL